MIDTHTTATLEANKTNRRWTYTIKIGMSEITLPATKARRGVSEKTKLGDIPVKPVFDFMGEEVEDRKEELRYHNRTATDARLEVGEATINAETGEIVFAHLYRMIQPGTEERTTALEVVGDADG